VKDFLSGVEISQIPAAHLDVSQRLFGEKQYPECVVGCSGVAEDQTRI
jgi:hypothetical protein